MQEGASCCGLMPRHWRWRDRCLGRASLAKSGLSVQVVEADGIASGATGAAEGLVGSIAKRKSGPVTDIVVKSFAMFPGSRRRVGVPR